MSLIDNLTQIYLKFNRRMLFDAQSLKKHREMKDQREYLESMKEPSDVYECSYLKYKCYAYYHLTPPVRFFYNCVGVIMTPVLAIILLIRTRKKKCEPFTPRGAVITASPTMRYEDILPPQIERDYRELREVKPLSISDRRMDKKGWSVFGRVLARYWMHPYFCLEALIRISGSCEIMYRYHPAANVGYGRERNFISPILLEYCKSLGVDCVSFMHGVFVYSIDKAYVWFTKYYVWEPYYIDMFTRLKARPGSLEVYTPHKFEPKIGPRPEGVPYDYFLTYYFTAESGDRMERIRKCLDSLRDKGYKSKLRPHPRFTDLDLLAKVFSGYYIEDREWTLERSMECSRFIAAYNSTVLTEAYYAHKEIVLDNYVDPSKFQNMIDREYIMLSRPHRTMTEVVREFGGVDLAD